jgi:conjugative transposon TraJ protein
MANCFAILMALQNEIELTYTLQTDHEYNNMKFFITILFLYPFSLFAQAAQVEQMHTVLENLMNEMLPMTKDMLRVAQVIACFGSLLYIGYRVWKQIAAAEPIDFFPLLRPFALSIAIAIFPQLVNGLNGILQPVTMVTGGMVKNAHADVDRLLHQRDLIDQGKGPGIAMADPGGQEAWNNYGETHSSGGFWSSLFTLNFSQLFKLLIATILEVLYYAAALCIDCMRTFHLVILVILGPLVFAISVYDGFQHTLSIWFARYINIYLWLPIANLFGAMIGKVQASMLRLDITNVESGQGSTFSQTDLAYLLFMVIGVVGYVSIPSIANYIVHASGGSAIMGKVNSMVSSQFNISKYMGGSNSGGGGASGGSMVSNIAGNDKLNTSMADAGNSNDYQNSKISGK